MDVWVPPYKRKSRIPLRVALYAFALLFEVCALVFAFTEPEPLVPCVALLLLGALTLAPAVLARDVVLKRVWSYISWASRP